VIDVGGEFFVSGGGLTDRFKVGRISFHWGRCNATSEGSEHSLNGMKYPLEMQIYCYDAETFENLDEAINAEGRIAALAVLFEVSICFFPSFSTIVIIFYLFVFSGKTEPIVPFVLQSLLPNSIDKYYIYNGSLTAPPCSETVEWVIFKHTVPISETQLEVFCEVLTLEQSGYVILTDYLQNNFRAQQQQFMGQVFASYTGVEEVLTPTCSSEPQNVQADAQNDTTVVVMWERPRVVYDTSIDWYLVTYQRLQGPQQSPQEYRTDGDQDVGAIISSLLSNSSYVVQVVSVCTNGLRGKWSDQIIVDMPQEDPGTSQREDHELNPLKSLIDFRQFYDNFQELGSAMQGSGSGVLTSQDLNDTTTASTTGEAILNLNATKVSNNDDIEGSGSGIINWSEDASGSGDLKDVIESQNITTEIQEASSDIIIHREDPENAEEVAMNGKNGSLTGDFEIQVQVVEEVVFEVYSGGVVQSDPGLDSKLLERLVPLLKLTEASEERAATGKGTIMILVGHILTCVSPSEGSNSSHESRVGLVAVDAEKRTVVPLAVVSTLTILCLLVLLGILIYWRYEHRHMMTDYMKPTLPIYGHEPLTVKQFVKHVLELHASNTFSKEFEVRHLSQPCFLQSIVQACTVDMGITSDSSNHPDNKSKNRYINILAYDHSRVKLSNSLDREGCGDYINANFVDGYERSRAYIAAQGPLRASREDFWRMIWQQNVGVIIMITNLKEKGRTKCDQYWPEDSEEDYGPYQVSLKSTKTLAYYTLRTLSVRDTSKSSQRSEDHTVLHFHYTQWPDMGVPEYTLPVLSFIRTSSQARTQDMGPVLVHCSAGVGRTGTYIVIDSMLQQIQDQGSVNVLGFLKHVRTQRNFLVQTEEQYVFIHDALVEAILSRETSVTSDLLHSYVSELLTPGLSGRTRMDKQFKLISQRQAKHADYSTALKEGNAERNRAKALMPVERSRVCLTASDSNSTGYINASYVMGHHHCREFIVTQTPLSSTVEDFWRMVLENNIHTVVCLTDAHSQDLCVVYCPSRDQPISFKDFTVSFSSEEPVCLSGDEKFLVQDFKLHCPQSNYEVMVRQYSAICWPNPDSPIRNSFDLINTVREHSIISEGPTLVHDLMGGPVSGLFCALTTLYSQLQEEGAVDVYLVARMTNLMRPGVFNDVFQFLYRSVLSLVSSQEDQQVLQSPETNGTVALGHSSTAESLESLM
ncbi:hypothetical protein NL108_000858, partial [Boleophthalmus pectinirostris]